MHIGLWWVAAMMLAVNLVGCAAAISIPPGSGRQIIQARPGQAIEVPASATPTEIDVPPAAALCFVRAARFKGVVAADCADVAREIKP